MPEPITGSGKQRPIVKIKITNKNPCLTLRFNKWSTEHNVVPCSITIGIYNKILWLSDPENEIKDLPLI